MSDLKQQHLTQEDLVLLYYGEPELAPDLRRHAAECHECREAADALSRTLNLCNEWAVPEPDAAFERSVWAGLVPALEESGPRRIWFPRWAMAGAAAAALLLIAFVAGRITKPPASAFTAGLSERARARILAISMADHLDRADMLFTEISNAADSGDAFSVNRARAQDLVEEGRLLRQMIAPRGETASLSIFDEVERFMLEVANAPDSVSMTEVREFRDRLSSGSLLFKVRIIESNLRSEGKTS